MKPESPRRWKASWIWPRDDRRPNLHLLFRKDFALEQAPDVAVLHIAAESSATVYLNDILLARTSANSYPHQHYYESHDCRYALRSGTNRLAVVVRYIGIPSSSSVPKDPGLLVELEWEDNGKRQSLGSDASWRFLALPAWLGQQHRSEWLNLDHVEMVDHRLLPEGFPFPGDESGFTAPRSLRWPGVRFSGLEPRPFPKTVVSGPAGLLLIRAGTVIDRCRDFSIPAIAVSEEPITDQPFRWDETRPMTIPAQPEGKAFALQFAFGDYLSGRPEIEVEAPDGAVLDLAWEENLPGGNFDVRTTRVYTADRHILTGGPNTVVPEDWLTGRFLQLTFRNLTRDLVIRKLAFLKEEYPLGLKLHVASSSPLLERIMAISMQAARRCMHDNIMDCPWRERRQWIGDVQRISLINHFAFGDRALVRGVLKQHIGMQDPSGRMWCCVPIREEYPTQSMEWVRAVLEYTDYTGDPTLLEEVTGNIRLLHEWFRQRRDEHGLLFIDQPPVMNWVDNPFRTIRSWQFQVPYLAQQLRYLLFHDDVAECLTRQGHKAEVGAIRHQREKLAAAIPACFNDPETGLLRDCPDVEGPPRTFSEIAHALAVCADIFPAGSSEELWDRFQGYAADHPSEIIPTSPFGRYHVHQALHRLDRHDAIIHDILEKWGPMVEAGADTTWEDFAGKSSHCHGWSGIPVVSLVGMVLGLDPSRSGQVRRENLGGIEWIEARISPS